MKGDSAGNRHAVARGAVRWAIALALAIALFLAALGFALARANCIPFVRLDAGATLKFDLHKWMTNPGTNPLYVLAIVGRGRLEREEPVFVGWSDGSVTPPSKTRVKVSSGGAHGPSYQFCPIFEQPAPGRWPAHVRFRGKIRRVRQVDLPRFEALLRRD